MLYDDITRKLLPWNLAFTLHEFRATRPTTFETFLSNYDVYDAYSCYTWSCKV